MTPIEDAISALEDAAALLEQVPLALRRTTQPGLWLGTPPPLVTPKLLRDEADHISHLIAEVRAADSTPEDGAVVGEWQETQTVDADEGPLGTWVTNVFIEAPPIDAVAEVLRRRIRDSPQA